MSVDRRAPAAGLIETLRASASTQPGAGASIQRPPAAECPGQTYYDTTLSALLYSTGVAWFNVATGLQVGNLLIPDAALVSTDAVQWHVVNCTVARTEAQAPAGRTSSLAITASSAGAITAYNLFVPVLPSTTYTLLAYTLAGSAARAMASEVSWYDSTHTIIGSTVVGSYVANSTTGWSKTTPLTTASPSNAAYANPALSGLALANGEVHYLTQALLAPGTFTDFIEP